jgi:hypothetical protein
MIRRIAPWLLGAVAGALLAAVAMVTCQFRGNEKWRASETALASAVTGSPDAPGVRVECSNCDWQQVRPTLPPFGYARCFDNVPIVWGWALECHVVFRDGQCMYADVHEQTGEWIVKTAGRLTSGCS